MSSSPPKPKPKAEPNTRATASATAKPTRPARVAKPQRGVQAVEAGGPLLLALTANPGPMLLKDLAAAARLPASRAHPYLVSFARLGLVAQSSETGRYALGPAALQMGLTCLFQSDPLRAATPVAQALAEQTGHAVALAVWGNLGPTVVRLIDARQPLHATLRAGTVMSVYGTATGRAFVAAWVHSQQSHRIEHMLTGPLAQVGLHSTPLPTAAQRKAENRSIAAEWHNHGLVRAVGKPLPGVNAFSAPVLDHTGQVALVITLLGAADYLPPLWGGCAARALREAAAQIAASLGAGLTV
jgi:DNA-binding IclR family transcriptional regulator